VVDEPTGIRELDQRIPFLLSQLGTYVADDFKRRLAPLGVDPRANAVLVALSGSDGQSQRQLSARLGLHRNVMVSLIDALEKQGLVERRPHPDDRRAFAVTLTDKARSLLPALEAHSHAMEDEVTASLTRDERAVLLDMLRRVSAGVGLSPGVHPRLAQTPPLNSPT
jgi:DNA-binding MarR family transcriptional regulator